MSLRLFHRMIRYTPLLIIIVVTAASLSSCQGSSANTHAYEMASLHDMPAEVQSAPASVQTAYQFAVANPGALENIPCYCGCGAMGHTSNYACYVAGNNEDGSVKFDSHALGCSICVDITQDTMRLMDEGKTPEAIRTYIDDTYARYGPSNIP